MFYRPKHFTIKELVDKKTYEMFGERSLMFFQPSALKMLDGVREFLDVQLIVNDWSFGGSYQFSGYRAKWVEIGGTYSQHRLCCAFDLKPKGMTITEAFNKIMADKDNPLVSLITAIEDISFTPTWLHTDCRNIPDTDRILIVKP